MLSNLLIPGEVMPTRREDPREIVKRAALTWADGARTEAESKILTALRRGGSFASAASLAAFVKLDAGVVRDALNELIARQLARWGNDQLGTGGYRAYVKSDGNFNIK